MIEIDTVKIKYLKHRSKLTAVLITFFAFMTVALLSATAVINFVRNNRILVKKITQYLGELLAGQPNNPLLKLLYQNKGVLLSVENATNASHQLVSKVLFAMGMIVLGAFILTAVVIALLEYRYLFNV